MPSLPTVVSVSSSSSSMPLLVSESVIFRKRPHFIIPFSLIILIWGVGGLFLWALVTFVDIPKIPFISLRLLEIIFLAVLAFVGLVIFLSWLRTEYILTNRRVEWRFGIIGQRTISISLTNIENISSIISILGRIFGYGNITIEPAGLVTAITFGGIAEPEKRREQIEQAIG